MKKFLILALIIMICVFNLTACPNNTNTNSTTLQIGDYILMGKYYNDPILWRCVDVDGNGQLMLSHRTLTIKPFDGKGSHKYLDGTSQADNGSARTNYGSNLWETSNIRSWLNSSAIANNVQWLDGCPPTATNMVYGFNAYANEKGFLANGNFTANERNAIKSVTQKSLLNAIDVPQLGTGGGTAIYITLPNVTAVGSNYNTAYSQNITDKMFLLDVAQLNKVYQNSNILGTNYYRGKPTQKAVDNSDFTAVPALSATNYWRDWLRSPDSESGYPFYVLHINSVGGLNAADATNFFGVRPAFYINLKSVILSSGDGSIGNPYVLSSPMPTPMTTMAQKSISTMTPTPGVTPMPTLVPTEMPTPTSVPTEMPTPTSVPTKAPTPAR